MPRTAGRPWIFEDKQWVAAAKCTAAPGQLPTQMRNAWDRGWRPQRADHFRLIACCTGCGSVLRTGDPTVYTFICTECRMAAKAWAARHCGKGRECAPGSTG